MIPIIFLDFFYGHTHADYIYEGCSFPIASIACNKCEAFNDKKPEGVRVPKRMMNHVSQDLWETMIVDVDQKKVASSSFWSWRKPND